MGWRTVGAAVAVMATVACGGASQASDRTVPPLLVGGVPDQDVTLLEERFDGVAAYLTAELGIPTAFQPSTDYAAIVTAFGNGDILLGWFGGLTGVQARLEVDGARAIAQRPIDQQFRSVFIAHEGVEAASVAELAGTRFTFGSESSTSGHLMPRHFLMLDGIDPEADFTTVGYSGSHDTTWQLVESGSYEAGVLNEAVWKRAVAGARVDTDVVRVVARTPPYFDYHWVAHPALDDRYGDGTIAAVTAALLAMDEQGDDATAHTLSLFGDEQFVETDAAHYDAIEAVARSLGLVSR